MMTRHEFLKAFASRGAVGAYETLFGPLWASGLQRYVPQHMHECVILWVALGDLDDDFLRAVVEGDLFEACAAADATNQNALFHYAFFFHNYTPSGCFRRGAADKWKGVCDA
jgi:hypothetical protein